MSNRNHLSRVDGGALAASYEFFTHAPGIDPVEAWTSGKMGEIPKQGYLISAYLKPGERQCEVDIMRYGEGSLRFSNREGAEENHDAKAVTVNYSDTAGIRTAVVRNENTHFSGLGIDNSSAHPLLDPTLALLIGNNISTEAGSTILEKKYDQESNTLWANRAVKERDDVLQILFEIASSMDIKGKDARDFVFETMEQLKFAGAEPIYELPQPQELREKSRKPGPLARVLGKLGLIAPVN